MRVRSVVLPAVLAVAAAVLAPTAAQAAVECGLQVPSKVVIDAPRVEADMRLTNGCFARGAAYAKWDVVARGTVQGAAEFGEDVFDEDPELYMWWDDTDVMGKWTFSPRGATTAQDAELTQNSAVTMVKYGSELTTKVTRSGGALSWAVTATQWSGRAHKDVARAKVSVGLFHQAPGSKTWTYVTSVTTSSTGKATVSLSAPKAGSYRLKTAETPTVWAAYSRTVQGRR